MAGINIIGLLLLIIGIIILFGGNYLLSKKFKKYETNPDNPAIGSIDYQVDSKKGIQLLIHILLRGLWLFASLGLILVGLVFLST